MHRRLAAALAPVLLLAACAAGESIVAAADVAEADAVAGGAWVLRTVDGAALPARVQESAEGYAVLLADTLRFDADSARAHGAVRVVAYGTAAPHDSVFELRGTRGWRLADGQVRIGDYPCGEPRELILCAPPDTGRVRGDTLALSTEMPGQPRRAYVRVGAP